jgi:hypothetical protein
MFRYALRRLASGRSAFLALFLSVPLAPALFSGILQGANALEASMLERALENTEIVSSAEDRNLTRASLAEVEEAVFYLLVLSAVAPILPTIKQASRSPMWRIQE